MALLPLQYAQQKALDYSFATSKVRERDAFIWKVRLVLKIVHSQQERKISGVVVDTQCSDPVGDGARGTRTLFLRTALKGWTA